MKKVKIALLAIFAGTLALGVTACRKNPETPPQEEDPPIVNPNPDDTTPETKTISVVRISGSISITDADTQETFLTKAKAALTLRVTYKEGGTASYSAADCDYDTSGIQWGNIGKYTVTVTPKDDNANNVSGTADVSVGHDFQNDVCSVDGATRVAQEIDVDLTYKLFHTGDSVYAAADEVSANAIRPFGTMEVNGEQQTVKTHTVGRLEKGMSITVKGTAETTYDELNLEDKYYYFPILGFADTSIGSYTGGAGTAIIVRNEGWVLLDGIGTPRLLAGNAAGGGGANDSGNYGSHPTDTGSKPENYDAHGSGEPALDQWIDWYTYSTGTTSNSSTYLDEQEIELTWTYYSNGVIELVYDNLTSNITLVSRTKVPDSSKGYYDTILHGEYVRMHFDEITTIQTTTLTGVFYEGIKSDARKVYLDNEMLDLSIFNVNVATEQSPTPSADSQFDIEANIGTEYEENWVSLSTTPLDSATMKQFRIVRVMGNVTKRYYLDASDEFITIKKNAVDRANPYTVAVSGGESDILFGNNSFVTVSDFAAAIDGENASAVLTITGRANSLSDEQKAALTGVAADKYIALRVWAREDNTAKFKGTPEIKSGETALAGAYVSVAESGEYLDLIIPVNASVKENGVIVMGLTENGVSLKLDLSAMEAISVVSKVEKGTLYLNKGGDVTVTYSMSAAEYEKITPRTRIYVNGSNERLSGLEYEGDVNAATEFTGKIGETSVNVKLDGTAHTVTVKYTLPKFNIEEIASYNLVLQDGDGTTLAADTVYYDMAFDDADKAVFLDNAYTEANGTTLNVVMAGEFRDISSEIIDLKGLYLSLNDGTSEGIVYKHIGFALRNGSAVFYDGEIEELATVKVTPFGTLDNSDDYDVGAVIVLTLDLTKLGVEKAPYYFDIALEGMSSEAPEYIRQVTENGVTATKPAEGALGAYTLVKEGSCQEEGYAGYPYTVDGKVVFYAGMAKIGGEHKFSGNTCEYCGATKSEETIPLWTAVKEMTIAQGEVLTVEGSYLEYLEGASSDDFYVGVTLQITTQEDGTFLWVRADRYAEIIPAANWNDRRVITDEEGTAVDYDDTLFPTNAEWLRYRTIEGARIVMTITLDNGVLTVIERNYSPLSEDPSELFYSVKYEFPNLTADSYKINFLRDTISLRNDNKVTVTKAKLAPNTVTGVTSSAVTLDGVEFAAANIAYTLNGTEGKYVLASANGIASKLTAEQAAKLGVDTSEYGYYAVVKVSLGNALDTNVWNTKLDGMKGKIVVDGKDVYAIIALNGEGGDAIVDLWNFEGLMTESDIKLDFSDVSASDVTAAVNTGNLSVIGGTATITYTGAPEGAKIEIGEKSFTVAELATEQDYENGIKATYANGVLTLTVAQPDFTKVIPEYSVNLRSGDGKLLMQNTITLNAAPTTGTNIEGAHVIVSGGTMTLVFTSGVAASSSTVTKTLYLNANSGKSSDVMNVRLYNLTFTVGTKGEIAFANTNALADGSQLVYSPCGVAAVIVDLTKVGIAADAAYSFELRYAETATSVLAYKVAADRTVSAISGLNVTDATAELQKQTCDAVGIAATLTSDESFYYNITVTPSHTWGELDENGFATCTVCGATLKSGFATNVTVAASRLTGITTDGLSVSFMSKGVSGDWTSQALVTAEGNMIITLPNLDPWNNTVASLAGATDEEKALAAKVKGAKCYPAGDNTMNGFVWNCYIGKEVYATVTISATDGISYYVDGVLAIQYPADKVVGTGTVGDFAKLFLSLAERTGLVIGKSGAQASDLLVQKGAYDEAKAATRYTNYVAEKSELPTPAPEPTHPDWDADPDATHPVTLGAADNSTGYTINMHQLSLDKGEKLELTGTMTSSANEAHLGNWSAIVATLYSGVSFTKGVFRSDNYILDGDDMKAENGWAVTQNATIAVDDAKEACADINGDNAYWASMRAVIAKCNVTATFDYSDSTKIVITLKYEATTEGYENTWTQSYEITATADSSLEDQYTVGLGIDGCCLVLNGTTRTNA